MLAVRRLARPLGTQPVPSDAFLCVRCGTPLAKAPSLRVPASVHDQNVVYATLFQLAVESRHLVSRCELDSGYIGFREGDYVAALSSGNLHGTNPADAAARHDALMLAADDLLHPRRHPASPHSRSGDRAREGGVGATETAAAKLTQPLVRRPVRGAVPGRRGAGEPSLRSPAG
jgi:hypothetical protein